MPSPTEKAIYAVGTFSSLTIGIFAYNSEPEFYEATQVGYKMLAPLAVGVATTVTTAFTTGVGLVAGFLVGLHSARSGTKQAGVQGCAGIAAGMIFGFVGGLDIGYDLSSNFVKNIITPEEKEEPKSIPIDKTYQENTQFLFDDTLCKDHDVVMVQEQPTLVLKNFAPA